MPLALSLPLLPLLTVAATCWAQEGDPSPALETLTERCAAGKVDRAFLEACDVVIRADVSRSSANAKLPGDFHDWLGEAPRLQNDTTLALALVGPKVASNLQLLRDFDEALVEKYPALAVAYAAAWSSGDDGAPRRYWVDDWLTRGRDVPEMAESFLFHVERREAMRVPLRDTPWPILAHLADSLVPIEERNWALERYGKRRTPALRELFGAVPYTLDPQRGDAPCTLQSFLEFGGPCTHNVQFAGGVFDAFGIPSGWAGGPGHTYPYWFEVEGRELTIHRTNELGNRNGKIRDPLGTGHVWEDELRLLVVALNHSVARYRRAALAAWAWRRLPEGERGAGAPILLAAVRENPYCHQALSAIVDATRAHQLSLGDAGTAWKAIGKALTDRPHDLPPLLDRALPPPGADAPTFDGDLALLKTLGRSWKKEGFEEALGQLPPWRARCLASRGKHGEAAREWRSMAKKSAATDPERFAEAVGALAAMTPGAPASEERVEVLTELLDSAEPRPREGWTELHRSRFHAVRRLVEELILLGREEEACTLHYEELAAARGDDPGTGAEPLLVGGGGGGPFEDAPEGAELVGVRVATTGYNGRSVIGCVQGLYLVDGAEMVGELVGQRRSELLDVKAPEGWRVAGVVAAGSDRLDGFQLVFVPRERTDRRIRMSDWVGSRREREVLLGGRGVRITGIRGRAGADVDAFGLIGTPTVRPGPGR